MSAKTNGKPDAKPVTPEMRRKALTAAHEEARRYNDLRNAWFTSGFKGYDVVTGEVLPPLGKRPPDPPRNTGTRYVIGGNE